MRPEAKARCLRAGIGNTAALKAAQLKDPDLRPLGALGEGAWRCSLDRSYLRPLSKNQITLAEGDSP